MHCIKRFQNKKQQLINITSHLEKQVFLIKNRAHISTSKLTMPSNRVLIHKTYHKAAITTTEDPSLTDQIHDTPFLPLDIKNPVTTNLLPQDIQYVCQSRENTVSILKYVSNS